MTEIRNLTKKYGPDKKAVDNLSLTINDGEVVAFIGHNGAGKTTTLKSMVGIIDFDEGEIFIDGISVKENPLECKKRIAYIPDNPDLYVGLKGIQYLNFVCDVYGVSKVDREELITKYADMFEITKNLGDVISSYSHGMKQKLAIISALVHKPKLLIMDEPFVGLDPIASHKLKQVFTEMCQDGSSIFFSTHVLDVAQKICDRVVIIKNGKLIAAGSMDEIRGNSSLEEVFLELVDHE